MGRRAQIGPSVGFVSHRGHLKGVCATASRACGSAVLALFGAGAGALWSEGCGVWAMSRLSISFEPLRIPRSA